jgi:hypothetical protein
MSKVPSRGADPGLRDLSQDDLGALERLAETHEQQVPQVWRRVRMLVVDERKRRTGTAQSRLRSEGSRQSEIPISEPKAVQSKRALNSIESVWRELHQAASQYTTDGARARALCRVLERLGFDPA